MLTLLGYAALSALLVGLYRWLALRYRWLDTPNQRSSHTIVTPRGAGLIFALLIVGAAIWQLHSQRTLLLPLLTGLAVAAVGWLDDLRGVSARARFATYFAAAAVSVALMLSDRSDVAPALLTVGGLLAAIALVWLINLYNFMDGINGIAACEALFVLLASSLLARATPYADAFLPLHLCSAAAIAGFLLWNFPVGRVFMGDAGSAFLGFFLGALALWSALQQGPALSVWLILLGAFIVDTSYTLLVRIATGQTWYAAHRLHAYQRLTDRLSGRHSHTVAIVMAINLCWLLPMAWLVQCKQLHAVAGLALAYAPLIGACHRLRAGIPARAGV